MRRAADLDLLVEDPGWAEIDVARIARAAAEATLARVGLAGPAEIVVLATSDAAVARLNADFRGKPVPTNVLSWPARTLAPAAPGAVPPLPVPDATGALALGDIALAFGVCAREAAAGGLALGDHVGHLVVHGILHLLGYDHICEEDAVLMEGRETEILATLGIADPHAA